MENETSHDVIVIRGGPAGCHSRWEDVFRDIIERDAERNAAFKLGS